MDAGLFGKVDLPPTSGAAQLPDPLTRRRTDVLCHAFIIGLAFALYLAHPLSGMKGEPYEPFFSLSGTRLLHRLPFSSPAN
jgi:hypothetical protein